MGSIEAAIKGKVDHLIGLKENAIIGKLIPAGTGMKCYSDVELDTGMPEETEEDFAIDEDEDDLPILDDMEEVEIDDEPEDASEDLGEDEIPEEDTEE